MEKSRRTLKSRKADLARCEEEAAEVRARMEQPLLLTALALMPPSPRVEELMGSIRGSFQKVWGGQAVSHWWLVNDRWQMRGEGCR